MMLNLHLATGEQACQEVLHSRLDIGKLRLLSR